MIIVDKTEQGRSTAEDTEPAPKGNRYRTALRKLTGRGRRQTVVVGLVVVALVVDIVISAIALHSRSAVAADRVAGEAAARSGVERLLSYDSANLQPTRAAIDDVATGSFHDQFVGVFTQVVSPNAIQQHAKSQATVRASGVVSAAPGHVVVLVFLNQDTTSSQLPAPRVDTIQTRVTMDQVDGKWLMSGLDQL